MRKYILLALALVALSTTFISCDDSISYADRLKSERKNIDKFLAEKNIDFVVLKDEFTDNLKPEIGKYYKDDKTGVYMCILDFGDKNHMANDTTYSRVNFELNQARMLSDTIYTPYPQGGKTLEFFYGQLATYRSTSSQGVEFYYKSPACAIPLKYVGQGGVVNLIVPFNQGSSFQREYFETIYLEKVSYNEIW